MLLLTIAAFAQENLFEAMIEFDGQEFKPFMIRDGADGFSIQPHTGYWETVKFDVVKNKYGKGVGLTKFDIKLGTYSTNYHKHTDIVDHYSQPAKIRISQSVFFESFVMVDGLLFELRESNTTLTRYDLNGSFVWVPVKTIEGDKEAKEAAKAAKKKEAEFEDEAKNPKKDKKKKKFGSFMKDLADKAKDVVEASMGAAIPTALKGFKSSDDIKNKVNTYLAAMKKKQGPYSAQEKIEVAHMKQILIDDNADIKKVNDAYWASPAGQETIRRMGNSGSSSSSSSTFTIKNNTDRLVSVIYNGYSKDIHKGSSVDWDCGTPVHYKVLQSGTSSTYVAGGLISSGKGVCGKTVNIR